MFLLYKDLEQILSAYGMTDTGKPRNSRNLKFDLLDQKSIRIVNRLTKYLAERSMTV